MRASFLLLIVLLLNGTTLKAQFPNPSLLNTGTNASGTGTLSANSSDLHWSSSATSSVGPWVPAVVLTQQTGWSASTFPNAAWITFPKTCSVSPADHSCMSLTLSEYYKATLTLPSLACGQSVATPSAYCLSLDFMADNCVKQIFVNGVSSYVSPVTNPAGYTGFLTSNKVTVSLCNNWIAGTNTIIVHTISGAYQQGGLSGFLAQANQTVNTTVGQPLSVASTQTNPACYGGTGSCTVTATGAVGAYTYSWLPSGGTSSVASNLPAGNYSCIVTSSNNCSVTKTLTITQPSQVTVTPASSSSSACVGNSIILSAQASGGTGPYSYSWTAGPGSTMMTVPGNTAGTFTYQATATDGANCSAGSTIAVTFVPNPVITNPGTVSICPGASATLSVSGAGSYQWFPSAQGGNTISVSPSSTASYTVIGSSAGCTTQANALVLVPPALTLTVSVSADSACIGTNIVLSTGISGGTAPFSYSWTSGAISSADTVTESSGGDYQYQVIVTDNNGCVNTATTSVHYFVELAPVVNQPTICPQDTAVLTATGAITYTWFPGAVTGAAFPVSPGGSSVYSVSGTSANGCLLTATTAVNIYDAPFLSFNTNSINCAHLGSATVTPSGPSGPFSFTWTPTAQSGPVATGLYPGTYTVGVTDHSTGCIFNPTVNFAPLVPLTATVSSVDSLRCYGAATASANITLSGGSGTQSYLWLGPGFSHTTGVAQGLSAGIHTVVVVDSLTHCSVNHTFAVNEPPQLVVSISAPSSSACAGDSVFLTSVLAGGTPAYTYSWAAGPPTTTYLVSQQNSGQFKYYFHAEDAYGCKGSDSIPITFVANPVLSVQSLTLCPAQQGFVIASGASNYSWSTGATGNILPVNLNSTTQFSVTGTAAACTGTAAVTVNIKPAPVPSPFSNSPICENDSIKLYASSDSIFVWQGPLQFTSAVGTPALANANNSMGGVYSVTVTAANGCTAAASTQVVVNGAPYAAALGATVCEGQPLNLWAAYINNASYYWAGPDTFTVSGQSFTRANIQKSMAGQYNFTVTNNNTGCTAISSAPVKVESPPAITLSGGGAICLGDSVWLGATGGTSYNWSGPAFQANQPTVSPGVITAGSSYSLVIYNGSCRVDTVVQVAVNALPTVTITAAPSLMVCEGSALQLNLVSQPAAVSCTWSGPSVSGNLQVLPIVSAAVHDSGKYVAEITDINGCKGKDSCILLVNPLPVVSIKGDTACVGEQAHLQADGGIVYLWTGPLGYTSTTAQIILPNVSQAHGGSYHVLVTDTNACTSSASVALVIPDLPLPSPTITTSGGNACINSSFSFGAAGGTSYYWLGPNGYAAVGAEAQIFKLDSASAGTYSLRIKNEYGCATDTTFNLVVFPQPVATLTLSKNNQCAPFCAELILDDSKNFSGPVVGYSVSVGLHNRLPETSVMCFTNSGEHLLKTIVVDSNGCSNTIEVVAHVLATPIADFTFYPSPVKSVSEPVQFFNHSDCRECSASWFFAPKNDSVSVSQPVYYFSEPGNHAVTLLVRSVNGCTDTLTKMISVEDEFNLYVPNAFTPDDDGLNDIFMAKGTGIDFFTMDVFDRWGEHIFSSSSIQQGWNGWFKGKLCKPDAYTWKISVKSGRMVRNRTGVVNLLR